MKNLIEEYLNYLELKGKSNLTIRNYRSYLTAFSHFEDDLSKITLDTVDKFQSKLAASGASLITQSYYLITLRTFFRYLRVRKDMEVLDPVKIELPRTRRKIQDALSEDEIRRLLKVAPLVGNNDIRARAILEFLIGSGVRVHELCLLKISQVDLREKWFRVLGKGNKERVCFMNENMVFALKKYLQTRGNSSGYLFTQSRYEGEMPISTRSIQRLLKEYGIKAGIQKPVTPHVCRRIFAVRLLRKNVDIRYIQEFLGHESIQTTQLYTNIERNDLERVYRLASRKVSRNVKKENEQILISRESLNALRGMIGKSVQQQNEILKEIKKENNVVEKGKEQKIIKPFLTVN